MSTGKGVPSTPSVVFIFVIFMLAKLQKNTIIPNSPNVKRVEKKGESSHFANGNMEKG
jgi:hypothetical protein